MPHQIVVPQSPPLDLSIQGKPGPEQIHALILSALRIGRALNPDIRSIGLLYDIGATHLGINQTKLTSLQMNKTPTKKDPKTSPRGNTNHLLCPKCNTPSLKLFALCRSCKASQNGTYKSKITCDACGFAETSKKSILEWLQIFRVDFKTQTKASLGIKTITDAGER